MTLEDPRFKGERTPREGEINFRDYHFKSVMDFENFSKQNVKGHEGTH